MTMLPRTTSTLCLGITVALGLSSRAVRLPGVLAEHTGDALYTVAVGWGLLVLWPAFRPCSVALLALLISGLVECQQLLRYEWLVALRASRFGALLLGQGFLAADLLAYVVGSLVVGLWVALLRRARCAPPEAS